MIYLPLPFFVVDPELLLLDTSLLLKPPLLTSNTWCWFVILSKYWMLIRLFPIHITSRLCFHHHHFICYLLEYSLVFLEVLPSHFILLMGILPSFHKNSVYILCIFNSSPWFFFLCAQLHSYTPMWLSFHQLQNLLCLCMFTSYDF